MINLTIYNAEKKTLKQEKSIDDILIQFNFQCIRAFIDLI